MWAGSSGPARRDIRPIQLRHPIVILRETSKTGYNHRHRQFAFARVSKGVLMSVATDHALATIASILHRPELSPNAGKAASPNAVETTAEPESHQIVEADGYSKTGPGPMAAIRFKWTVRRADDGHYVDETVGTGSATVSSGPMSAGAAIKFVDDRAAEAHARFEALKSEMTGRGPIVPFLPTGVGEK